MTKFKKIMLCAPLVLAATVYGNPFDGNLVLESDSIQAVDISAEESEKVDIQEAVMPPSFVANSILGIKDAKGLALSNNLKLRKQPWGETIATVKGGEEVEIIDSENDWYHIRYNGNEGYVHSSWVDVKGFDYKIPTKGFLIDDAAYYDENGNKIGNFEDEMLVQILADYCYYWKISVDSQDYFVKKTSIDTDFIFDSDDDEEESTNSDSEKKSDTADEEFDKFVDNLEDVISDDPEESNNSSDSSEDDSDDSSDDNSDDSEDSSEASEASDAADDNEEISEASNAGDNSKDAAIDDNQQKNDLKVASAPESSSSNSKLIRFTSPTSTGIIKKLVEIINKTNEKVAELTKKLDEKIKADNKKEDTAKKDTAKKDTAKKETVKKDTTKTETTKTETSKTVVRKLQGKKVTLPAGDKVYFLDVADVPKGWNVEKGADCIIIESEGKFGMIDTGMAEPGKMDTTARIKKYLKELGIKKLDFLLFSHTHGDHDGGFKKAIVDNGIKIKTLYLKNDGGKYNNDVKLGKKAGATIYTVEKHKSTKFTLGNMKFELFNTKKTSTSDKNINTVVAVATVNGKKICFGGDMQSSTSGSALADSITAKIGKVDVYKAAHHGYTSPTSTTRNNSEKVFKNLKPKYVVVTNTARRLKKSHMYDTFMSRAKKHTDKKNIYFTGDGTIVMNISSKGEITFKKLAANK